jgi:hypothetical protein
MSESPVAGLKDQLREIEGRLDAAQDNGAREEVKREIIALFKRVDAALTELNQLKDGIRGLAERYKQINNAAGAAPAGPAPAPQFTGARPAVQADHLGASTFLVIFSQIARRSMASARARRTRLSSNGGRVVLTR